MMFIWVLAGRSGEELLVQKPPDLAALRLELQRVWDRGIRSVAVLLLHSYTSVLPHNRNPQVGPQTLTPKWDPKP